MQQLETRECSSWRRGREAWGLREKVLGMAVRLDLGVRSVRHGAGCVCASCGAQAALAMLAPGCGEQDRTIPRPTATAACARGPDAGIERGLVSVCSVAARLFG